MHPHAGSLQPHPGSPQPYVSQGSILTVEPAEAAALSRPTLRRWIYNSPTCGRCMGRVAARD